MSSKLSCFCLKKFPWIKMARSCHAGLSISAESGQVSKVCHTSTWSALITWVSLIFTLIFCRFHSVLKTLGITERCFIFCIGIGTKMLNQVKLSTESQWFGGVRSMIFRWKWHSWHHWHPPNAKLEGTIRPIRHSALVVWSLSAGLQTANPNDSVNLRYVAPESVSLTT